MLIETTLDLGDFCDGYPLAKVNNLPTSFLDTDGMVIDRYADIPLYSVIRVDSGIDGELLTAVEPPLVMPERKRNDFADNDSSEFDLLAGIDAVKSDTSANTACGVGQHSRAYSPVSVFHYAGSSRVFLSLSGDDGKLIDDVSDVCVMNESGVKSEVNNGLILLSGVAQGVAILLGVSRRSLKRHRVSIRFN